MRKHGAYWKKKLQFNLKVLLFSVENLFNLSLIAPLLVLLKRLYKTQLVALQSDLSISTSIYTHSNSKVEYWNCWSKTLFSASKYCLKIKYQRGNQWLIDCSAVLYESRADNNLSSNLWEWQLKRLRPPSRNFLKCTL